MKHDFNTLHLGWAIRNIPQKMINGHEKSILLILLLSTGHENLSWYSLKSISEMACFSLDTIRRNLKTLEQKKFITITKPSKYGRAVSNHYALNVDEIMVYSKLEKDSCEQSLSGKRVADSNGRVAHSHPERVADSTTKKESLRKKEERARPSSSEEVLRSDYVMNAEELKAYYIREGWIKH
jgi:DNA-binding MarR family transcriptional regulator